MRWQRRAPWWIAGLDALSVSAASLGAYAVRQGLGERGVVGPFQNELPVALAVLPLWLLVL